MKLQTLCRSITKCYNPITFSEFEIIGKMFEFVYVGFAAIFVGQVCYVETFLLQVVDEDWIEVVVVGCYVESGWEAGSMALLLRGGLVHSE